MKIGLVLASLVAASSSAYAQAPGDYNDGDIAPPGMAPAGPVGVAPAPVRQTRWSVGLNFGSLNVAPHMQPDNKSDFSVGAIALRYRPWQHLELELTFGGGSEQLPDGTQGDREVHSSVLSLRYRFNPMRSWNWWLGAGMGSFAVTNKGASDAEQKAAVQSTLQFGIGLEKRWTHFALNIEVRAVGVAPNDQQQAMSGDGSVPVDGGPNISTTGGMTPPPPPKDPGGSPAIDGWKGGQTTIGASYYF